MAPRLVERSDVGVVVDADVFKAYFPPIPTASSLILGLTCRAVLMGSFLSTEQSQKSVSDGRGTLLKLGVAEGWCGM